MKQLSNKVLVIITILFTQSIFAAPMHCYSDESPYSLNIASNGKSAKVFINNEFAMWGQLDCLSKEVPYELLSCHSSQPVNDAGYSASIVQNKDGSYTGRVSEISFLGAKTVAILPICIQALHSK